MYYKCIINVAMSYSQNLTPPPNP